VCDMDTRYQGSLGIDALRAMKAVIDLENDRLLIGNESYQLADCSKQGHCVRNACLETQTEWELRTDHPTDLTHDVTGERPAGLNPTIGKASGSRNPNSRDGKNVKLHDDSKRSAGEVWGVMPSNTTVPARSTIIARLDLVPGDKTRIPVGQIRTSILVERAGTTIPGISAGRALSDIRDSGEFGNPSRGKPSWGNADSCRELSKRAMATVSSMLHNMC
jgi:hypothetical protein